MGYVEAGIAAFMAWGVVAKAGSLFIGYLCLRGGLASAQLWIARRTHFGRSHRVYADIEPTSQIVDEIRHMVVICAFDAIFLAFFVNIANLQVDIDLKSIIFVVVIAIFVNEFVFYAFHRLFHTHRFYFLHAQHHTARISDPFTSFSFSLVEHIAILPSSALFIAALSYVFPVSLLSILSVAVVNEALASYGHWNVEIWRVGFTKSLLGKMLMTPTYHSMHHARFNGNYGLYTRIPDRIFGTEWADYPALHDRTASGSPLPSLGTHGGAGTASGETLV
jgi:sterol desaturase/sphingolipid hydroxylase (fatty acid hydroxylase superfamily)